MSASDSVIFAPFTEEQVGHLTDWQTNRYGHPFTCGRCRDANMDAAIDSGSDWHQTPECELLATPAGWVCETCDYTQDWAWSFMAEPHTSWSDLLAAAPPSLSTKEPTDD